MNLSCWARGERKRKGGGGRWGLGEKKKVTFRRRPRVARETSTEEHALAYEKKRPMAEGDAEARKRRRGGDEVVTDGKTSTLVNRW